MGYTVNFYDNQSISAEMLNSISGDLGANATEFLDNTSYGVDDLNDITYNLVQKGVLSGCTVTVSDGNAVIAEGIAFFSDGKKIKIDAQGITLPLISDSSCYVYLENNPITSIVVPRCTAELSDNDNIVLAQISTDLTVTSMIEAATAKVLMPLSTTPILRSVSIDVPLEAGSVSTMTQVVDNEGRNVTLAVVKKVYQACGYYNFNDNTYYSVATGNGHSTSSAEKCYLCYQLSGGSFRYATAEFEKLLDGKIQCNISQVNMEGRTISFDIILY